MPKEKWPEIRKKYLTEHQDVSEKDQQSDSEDKEEVEDPQITAAKQFFGENFNQIVKIKED